MSPVQFKAGLTTGAGTGAAVGSTAWTEERAHKRNMVTRIARMAMVRFVFWFWRLICCLLVFVSLSVVSSICCWRVSGFCGLILPVPREFLAPLLARREVNCASLSRMDGTMARQKPFPPLVAQAVGHSGTWDIAVGGRIRHDKSEALLAAFCHIRADKRHGGRDVSRFGTSTSHYDPCPLHRAVTFGMTKVNCNFAVFATTRRLWEPCHRGDISSGSDARDSSS
jgi:hypothetical protein